MIWFYMSDKKSKSFVEILSLQVGFANVYVCKLHK